jgi:DNA polymerase V
MLKFIPLKAQAGFTGFESPSAEYVQKDLDLGQLLIDHPTATYIGYAEGESMVDAGIHSGDLLLISRAEEVKNNDIIVANLNGVFVVKQVDKPNKQLLAAAKGYAPYVLNSGDEFQIEGVVTRSIRLHRPLAQLL